MRKLDPSDNLDLIRLRSASDASKQRMQKACEERMKLLRCLVGPYYPGEEGARERRPVNLIELGVDIFQRHLASHEPQVIIQTDHSELAPTAADFETILNRRIRKIRLKDALNTCALEALLTMGVMCVGVGIEDGYDAGCVFAEPILFPDLILDMAAKSWGQQSFVGHDFLVPLEWVEDNKEFKAEAREKFSKWAETRFNNSRDWQSGQAEDYQDLVKLRQIYLVRQKKIVLFAVEGPSQPLMVTDWEGPDNVTGPYYQLAFRTIPGNIFPLAPAPMWYDLDDFANRAYNKIFRQTDRCKTIGLTQSAEDADAVVKTSDGGVISVTDPKAVVEVTYGGANKNILAVAQYAQELLNQIGGNWNLIGGLAPSSGTVGQDQLLSQGATGRMKDMQQTMTEFETDVITAVGFWEWENPVSEERFTKRLQGTDFGLPDQVWSPETRSGEFFQLNLSVNPYSRVNRSPSEQASFIVEMLERVLLPSLQFMQQDGPVDWEGLFKLIARYNNAPELNQLIRWPQGESQPSPMPDQPRMPSNTKRTYERINTQGGSRNPLGSLLDQFDSSGSMNGEMQQAG